MDKNHALDIYGILAIFVNIYIPKTGSKFTIDDSASKFPEDNGTETPAAPPSAAAAFSPVKLNLPLKEFKLVIFQLIVPGDVTV